MFDRRRTGHVTLRQLETNVQLIRSTNCTVMNIDSSFADIGILLVDSRGCNIDDATLTNCRIGLQMLASSNNSITGNYLLINDFCGIDFDDSENNSFHHNTVNSAGATCVVFRAGLNTWDDGFEGNYWSDYNGTDNDQNGIGDTPYIIDANNTDHYPLVAKPDLVPVHNLDTELDYTTIQAAIDAPETLNGHRISVEAGREQGGDRKKDRRAGKPNDPAASHRAPSHDGASLAPGGAEDQRAGTAVPTESGVALRLDSLRSLEGHSDSYGGR